MGVPSGRPMNAISEQELWQRHVPLTPSGNSGGQTLRRDRSNIQHNTVQLYCHATNAQGRAQD